jgi:hypothetical protein
MTHRAMEVDGFVNRYLMRKGSTNAIISNFCIGKEKRMRKTYKKEQYSYWGIFFRRRIKTGEVSQDELAKSWVPPILPRSIPSVARVAVQPIPAPSAARVVVLPIPAPTALPTLSLQPRKKQKVQEYLKCPTCRQHCDKQAIYPLFGLEKLPDCPVCLEPKVNRVFSCGHFACSDCIEVLIKQI